MSTDTIKVGVLFSQSGPMAVTESAHIEGVVLACAEINENGGIDGTPIEPIILDPGGDDDRYAAMAVELMAEHQVRALFGCCLSASRKRVVPLIERFDGVLFYPSVYEGFEFSPNVLYGGAAPNQMILPLLEHLYAACGARFALVGSDTLYAREVNRIVAEFLAESGGEVTLETYLGFGAGDGAHRAAAVRAIDSGASVVLCTTVGNESVRFYRSYADVDDGSGPPLASLTVSEAELRALPSGSRDSTITAAAYFGSLQDARNLDFVARYQARYGQDTLPGVYTQTTYCQMQMFARAVRHAADDTSTALLEALRGARLEAPGGPIAIDPETHHTTLRPLIGLSRDDGSFGIVSIGARSLRPDPYLVAYDRTIAASPHST